jgi:hypothetical protein
MVHVLRKTFTPTIQQHINHKPSLHFFEEDESAQLSWQEARIATFEAAYKTKGFYSLSYKPLEPQIKQIWFFRACHCPSTNTEPYSFGFTRMPPMPHAGAFDTKPISGFLKPYHTFTSNKYIPDSNLDNLPVIVIRKEEDLSEVQEQIKEIARNFLNDTQAKALAVTTIQEGNLSQTFLLKPHLDVF